MLVELNFFEHGRVSAIQSIRKSLHSRMIDTYFEILDYLKTSEDIFINITLNYKSKDDG